MNFLPRALSLALCAATFGVAHAAPVPELPVPAPVPATEGRSAFVPQIKIELLDSSFALGGLEGDAAHEARFKVTVTTGGAARGDGFYGERMVGYRVPPPRIVAGAAGIFGEHGPRVIMTQPLTDERGQAWGKVVSGWRQTTVKLAYSGGQPVEISSEWSSLSGRDAWISPRFLQLKRPNAWGFRMAFERNGKTWPMRGHSMEFSTSGAAGCLWRGDYGADLDGDGKPDGDYLYRNAVIEDQEESPLVAELTRADRERFFDWAPSKTRGKNGVYSSQFTVKFDPRFVIDAQRESISDNNAYTATGMLNLEIEPRSSRPRPLQLQNAPVAPAVWNRATVSRFLAEIERPRRAALLKGLYFGAHLNHALPAKEGYGLLVAASQKAKPASRRWFLLMALRAFAGLRTEKVAPGEGFAVYRALFERADKAPKVGAQQIVAQAVADYVNSAPIGFDQYDLSDVKGGDAATVAAWKAYSLSQSWAPSKAERADRPLWSLLFSQEGVPTPLVALAARQSQTWKSAPRAWRFEAASALHYTNQRLVALQLWKSLKNQMKDDPDRWQIVYANLIEASSWDVPGEKVNWKVREAKRRNLAQERSVRTGRGWATRIVMAPDGAASARIARELLERPRDADWEREVLDSANALLSQGIDSDTDSISDARAARTAQMLLRALLGGQVSTISQWQARFKLAMLLDFGKQRPQARQILAAPFRAANTPAERELFETIQQARAARGSAEDVAVKL